MNASATPSPPAPTGGYSGTPLIQKLGIKPGHRLAFVRAPEDFAATLGPLPATARLLHGPATALDVIVLFSTTQRDLETRFAALTKRLEPAGALWIAWPKKASGVRTDLHGNVVRDIGLAGGLVDVKVCAIDAVWSGLKFVRRLRDR